ncbi:MAG: hypothetical protein HW390_1619 [Candidatus Brocadiaceae bacterium]|nr:hypothetical protein [Candidatus Brocadiaceae bacterium]
MKSDSPEWDTAVAGLASEIKTRHYSRKTLKTRWILLLDEMIGNCFFLSGGQFSKNKENFKSFYFISPIGECQGSRLNVSSKSLSYHADFLFRFSSVLIKLHEMFKLQ